MFDTALLLRATKGNGSDFDQHDDYDWHCKRERRSVEVSSKCFYAEYHHTDTFCFNFFARNGSREEVAVEVFIYGCNEKTFRMKSPVFVCLLVTIQ
mmetsp:Transcript_53211/g.159289  ORF Transcript_53211/g.159289 Transcript_53211/m.159289 type:complete len:96 (-) Transcript_53211:1393-1680(-)